MSFFESIKNRLTGKKTGNYFPMDAAILKAYNQSRPLGAQPSVCYAPFKNMYFGHEGKVIACCYNRSYELGTWPELSIKEIWFGKAANQLRDYLSHSDLSLGCSGCHNQLIAGNFDATKAKQYDELPANENKMPSVLEFELSNLCNLECDMCNGDFSSLIRKNREGRPAMQIPYNDEFIRQLEEFIPHLTEVKFYGGEPFLIELYAQIWEKIIELKPSIRISVQTNATILNERVKRILSQSNFHINVSIDSLQKETYELIRRNAKFERVMEHVKYFREYCRSKNTFFGISACAMRQNWKELPEFIRFCNELEAPVYFHTVFYPPHCSLHNLEAPELKKIIDYLKAADLPMNNATEQKNRLHFEGIINQLESWHQKALLPANRRYIQTFDDLFDVLAERLQSNPRFNEKEKLKRSAKLRKKIDKLAKALPPESFNLGERLKEMDFSDPFLKDNIISYIEKSPTLALVALAKTIR